MDDNEELTPDTEDTQEASALQMSDEEFLEMGDNPFLEAASEAAESEASAGDEDSNEEAEAPEETDEEEAEEDNEESVTSADSDEENTDEEGEEADEGASEASPEDFVKQVMQPFKANGREMQVESAEDVVRLMQMGANYNQKMHAMKPNMKILKTLEKNGLLDEGKLNFLIDIDKKNPEAIAKLIKDSEIDPMDFSTDDEEGKSNYEVPDYTVGEAELRLNEVITSIESTDTYDRTMDVVGNKWDNQSRQLVAEQPELLRVLNDHMASGVHDLISTEVEKARMFGRLDGMTDLQAYQAVGDQLHQAGKFNHLQGDTAQPQPTVTKRAPKPKVSDAKRNAKKRAASPTKASKNSSTPSEYSPLAMSDEEFEKLDARFI